MNTSNKTRVVLTIMCVCLALTFLFPWTQFTPWEDIMGGRTLSARTSTETTPYLFFMERDATLKKHDWSTTLFQALALLFASASAIAIFSVWGAKHDA